MEFRTEIRNDALIIAPQDRESRDWFKQKFPDDFLKTSKHVKIKKFTDRFGSPTDDHYMELKGMNGDIR